MKTKRYAVSPLIQVKLNSNLVHLFSLGTSFIISNLKKLFLLQAIIHNCAYCTLVEKSKGNTFKSVSNGKRFKIRQKINCTSKNLIYMVRCKRCNLQGVGHTTNFKKRISNYFSHIKQNTRDCEISCHFIDNHKDTWIENYARNEEFEIIAIAKLENPPRSKKALEQRLIEFEGYWQAQLGTIHPKGLNIRNELKRSYYKYNTSF